MRQCFFLGTAVRLCVSDGSGRAEAEPRSGTARGWSEQRDGRRNAKHEAGGTPKIYV
jgi:hypothetical protein